MFPIILTPQNVRIGLTGQGQPFKARLRLLNEAAMGRLTAYEDRVPEPTELESLDVLFVAGLDESVSRQIYADAKVSGILVNVEDIPKLCDFHVPAQLRRGELLITVSTGGRSPGLASKVRDSLEEIFGTEWEAHVDEVAISRARWRASGLSSEEIARRTRELIDSKGWLGRTE